METATKKNISDCFSGLTKWGYTVMNAQDNYRFRMPKGMKGFSDYFIFGKGHLYFIENKFKSTKDKHSKEQTNFRFEMKYAAEMNPFVFYIGCTEDNYKDIYMYILQGDFKKLKLL